MPAIVTLLGVAVFLSLASSHPFLKYTRQWPGAEVKLFPSQPVICPDNSGCSNISTCCKSGETVNGTDTYGCCPEYEGVCCSDLKHCCPKGYTCGKEKCLTSNASQPFLELKKPSTRYTACPNGELCPDGNTCCSYIYGAPPVKYGCCPESFYGCCSTGYAYCCSNTGTFGCYTGGTGCHQLEPPLNRTQLN